METYERKGCGTDAGFQWHLRNEGKPVRCEPCLEANRVRMAGRDNTQRNQVMRERYAFFRAQGYSSREATRLRYRKGN